MTENELAVIIEKARQVKMSAAEAEQQRRSFAYGSAKIENELITKEMIDAAAEELAAEDNAAANRKIG